MERKMRNKMENFRTQVKRHLIVPVIAIAMTLAVGAYEFTKPLSAHASMAPSAPALDDNSVGPLLSLDQAMETLAARVTPAIVNVPVTSRAKANPNGQMPENMQQFFGPFGQFGPNQQPRQPRVERGLGRGGV